MNEEGSEAAASTGLALDIRSGIPNDLKEFKVNRPFIFYIYDKENNFPLFIGRVVDPSGVRDLEETAGPNDVKPQNLDKTKIDFSESKKSHLNNFNKNKAFEDQRWKDAFEKDNSTQS